MEYGNSFISFNPPPSYSSTFGTSAPLNAPYAQTDAMTNTQAAMSNLGQYQNKSIPTDKQNVGQTFIQPNLAYQPVQTSAAASGYGQAFAYGGYVAYSAGMNATYVGGTASQPTVVVVGQPSQTFGGHNVLIVGASSQTDTRVQSIGDLLGISIFTMLCCNVVLGIVAIVFSFRVRDAKYNNDYHRAKSARSVSLAMNIIGILLTVAVVITLIVYYAVVLIKFGNSPTHW